jgi:hypothetical protein
MCRVQRKNNFNAVFITATSFYFTVIRLKNYDTIILAIILFFLFGVNFYTLIPLGIVIYADYYFFDQNMKLYKWNERFTRIKRVKYEEAKAFQDKD